MIFYVCLSSFLIFLILYREWYNRLVDTKSYKIPGPQTIPIIGNAHLMAMQNSTDVLNGIDAMCMKFGTRFRIFMGNQMFLFLYGIEDIEFVLTSDKLINKASDYKYIQAWIGTGLVTANGEKWRKHRKAIAPTFHFKFMEQYIHIFDTQSNILINKLHTHTDEKSFDLFPYMTLCTLDIISEAALGVSAGAQNNSDSEYVQAVNEISRIYRLRLKNLWKRSNFLFMFTRDYWKQRKVLKILHGTTYKMIEERKRFLEKNAVDLDSTNDDDAALGKKKKLAFLDMLLLSKIDGKPFDEVEIREEVDTILLAGHDTSSCAISFTLYLISQHPEVQKKVFDEQKDIFGNDFDRPTLHKDLQDMKYLELVIKEAMRLYPPAQSIGRTVYEDVAMNDLFVPAGTTLVLLFYNMNRNPKVFPEPEKFIPERFLPDQVAKRSPFSTLPFSAGPRSCIAQKFAMLEMKTVISKVIRNFELLPSYKKFTLTNDLTLKPVEGLYIKVTKRSV